MDVQKQFDAYRKTSGLKPFKLNRGQRVMAQDGVPLFCFMTPAERRAAWERDPPKAPALWVDPRQEELRIAREQQRKEEAAARIAAMKRNLEKKNKKPFDPTGHRWDTRYCKWVKDTSTQESEMARIKVFGFDTAGAVVTRAGTSLPEDATEEQIADKVQYAFTRGGKSVTSVSVTGIGGQRLSAWGRVEGVLTRNDDLYQSAPVAEQEQESEVAKKSAKKKAPAKKKAGGPKGPGVIATIVETISQPGGASAEEVLKVLVKKFPDRSPDSMITTVKIQANKNAKKKERDEKRGVVYFGKSR